MTDVLDAVVTRFDAILAGGRGANGALGALAQARSIPADRYRKSADNFSLKDPSYPAGMYDRAYGIEWGSLADLEEVGNVRADVILQTFDLTLTIGHLYGDAHAAFIKLVGGEVAATVARQGTSRAAGDVVRILRALRCGELWGNDTDPVIVDIRMAGPTIVDDLVDRLLTVIPLKVVLNITQTGYTP